MTVTTEIPYEERIKSGFLRSIQTENNCCPDGKPCQSNCGCELEMEAWIDAKN